MTTRSRHSCTAWVVGALIVRVHIVVGTLATIALLAAGTALAPSLGRVDSAIGAEESGTPLWADPAEIEAFLRQQQASLKLTGVAVIVIADGQTLFEGAYGIAPPEGREMTLDTPIVLGSTSKQFTGLAVQQLIADGQLSLDDTIAELAPAVLPDGDDSYADVTVSQLLGHRTGVGADAGVHQFRISAGCESVQSEARYVLGTDPVAAPDERFEYSNGNYTVLGAMIEVVAGKSFPAVLEERVFRPLGLESTTAKVDPECSTASSAGYYTWFGVANTIVPQPVRPALAPAAFMTSTANDLERLLRIHLGIEASDVGSEVLAASRDSLGELGVFAPGVDVSYASGWVERPFWELHGLDENRSDPSLPRLWEHNGTTDRSMSYLAFAPESGFAIAFVTGTSIGIDESRLPVFMSELVHVIVGTDAPLQEVDPLIVAAPALMIGLPIALLILITSLSVALGRGRAFRPSQWITVAVGAMVALACLVITTVVVPARIEEALLSTAWWANVPDLALSVLVTLVLSIALAILVVWRGKQVTRRRVAGTAHPEDDSVSAPD